MKTKIKHFVQVVIGLIAIAVITLTGLSTYRGFNLYLGEFREAKGKFMKAAFASFVDDKHGIKVTPIGSSESDDSLAGAYAKIDITQLTDEAKQDLANELIEDGFSVPRNTK